MNKSSATFSSWTPNWFGYFSVDAKTNNVFPNFDEFVDNCWDPSDKKLIISYLKDAVIVISAGQSPLMCHLCLENLGDRSQHRSDNEWVWPAALWHFVEHHGIRLPERFLAHIRNNKYQPPKVIDVKIQDLPFPK